MRRRAAWACAVLVAAALGAGRAAAVGTIDTSGATIATGASSTQGTVTIDPAAGTGTLPGLPGVTAPGSPPQMTGALPQAPSYGDGSMGALSTSGAVVLGPGTHSYASIEILPGGSITCGGATTILVTGNVDLYGPVSSATPSSPIAIRCGGNFQLHSASPANSITTSGTLSAIEVTAGGLLNVGTGQVSQSAVIRAATGDVRLQALGTQAGSRGLLLAGGEARAPAGRTTLISAAELDLGSSGSLQGIVEAGAGPAVLQSFSERMFLLEGAVVTAPIASEIRLESAGIFQCQGSVQASNGTTLTVRAVSGPLTISGTVSTTNGQLLLASGGDINIYSRFANFTGSSVGGDVALRTQQGAVIGGNLTSSNSNGEITVVAQTGVRIENNAVIDSQADVEIEAFNGAVIAEYDAQVKTTRNLLVRASGDLILAQAPGGKATQGSTAVIRGATVTLSCGGDALLDAAEMRATGSSLTLLAADDIDVARTVSAFGDIALTSQFGDIDASSATLTTDAANDSGGIVVETYKAAGSIDASGATIRSGDGGTTSGDVSLLVHDEGLPPPPPPPVISYVLPKKVVVKVVAGKPEKTSLAASGFFDTGPEPLDLTQAATVTVGSKDFSVSGFTRKGAKFVHTEPGLVVQIVPAKTGSSRAKFRLNAKGVSLDGAIAPDTEVELAFAFGAVTGTGRVKLDGNAYVLGAKAGSLVEPIVFPVKVAAKLRGDRKDSLQLVAGFATDGSVPASAPDVTFGLGSQGGTYWAIVAGNFFVRKGAKFVSPEPRLILDYAKNRLTFVATDATLGAPPDGPQPVTITMRLGSETREVRVRMVRKGKKLLY